MDAMADTPIDTSDTTDITIIGPHRLLAGDVTKGVVGRLMSGERAEVVYSDPPWGGGNLKYWRTHAGMSPDAAPPWVLFVECWSAAVSAHLATDGALFVEMGLRWADHFAERLAFHGRPVTRRWQVTYRGGSKLLPNALLYAGPALSEGFDPSTLRGEALPRACVAAVAPRYPGGIVLDPCCGKGYTARAAHRAGLAFRGSELNPKRLGETAAWLRAHAHTPRGANG